MKAFPQMLTIRTCLCLLFVSEVIAKQTLGTEWTICTPDPQCNTRTVSYRYIYRVRCSDGRQIEHTRNTSRDCAISFRYTQKRICSSSHNCKASVFREPIEVWLEWYNLTTCSTQGTTVWQRFGYLVQNNNSQQERRVQFRTQTSERFCSTPITTDTTAESWDSSSTIGGVTALFLLLIVLFALVICRLRCKQRKAISRAARNNRQNTNDRGVLQFGVNFNFCIQGQIGRDSSRVALGRNARRNARRVLSPSRNAVLQNGTNPRDDANATEHSLPPSYEDANRISVSVSSTNPLTGTTTTSPVFIVGIPPPAYDQVFDTGPPVGGVADESPPPYHEQGRESGIQATISTSVGYL